VQTIDCLNDTPTSRKNKHLNVYERDQIALLHSEGLPAYSIVKSLNRAFNTIRNELKRGTFSQIKANKKVDIYFPDNGHIVYENNRKNCGSKLNS